MKNRKFVNLNFNPCKMCMPMGAALAFKGISGSMFMLHGSQGCSTYIRRHMAGHFNEPVDIASSSLNEEGTVYGGESNLKKGLRNLIKLYRPQVIGVGTTCLAETIGEDVIRIISSFSEEEGVSDTLIMAVSTPGYGGTQFEGYYSTLSSILKRIAADSMPNGRINIIAPSMLSPADIRNIKGILDDFQLGYILLPDISDTLDAPYTKEYSRIPEGGTRLKDIRKMAGAAATIELCMTVPPSISPGKYLNEQFGIPLFRCPVPIGIEFCDKFMTLLSQVSGLPVPVKYSRYRGRLIDGMIDSHKHNGEGRAVVYGEPEQVLTVSRLCLENGIKPVLVCTGSRNDRLESLINDMFGNDDEEKPNIIEDTDFEAIQRYAVQLEANILIGNSDGKIITEKEGIPLVRMGFPIHDRVGGQRLVYSGYNGTLKLLDDITNTLLEHKYEKYRDTLFNRYFNSKGNDTTSRNIDKKTGNHPCYSSGACGNARMHIPVAAACNISCNYCNRKYDCVNESRPGVTSEILSPSEAAQRFVVVKEKLKNLKVVGIAGPGDALANFDCVAESLRLIRGIDPDITFCLSTNGLMLPAYVDEIVKLGVTHVTVTINAIDPVIGARIYEAINYNGEKLRGEGGVALLIRNQLEGLKMLTSMGVVCKVNIVVMKGINDGHIEDVVKKVKECGAFMTNIMPLIPAKGSVFGNMQLTSNKEINELRKRCGLDLKQMYHCRQCRADAIGLLEQNCSADFREEFNEGRMNTSDTKDQKEYRFAVATKTGLLVDAHFGQVKEFYIYSCKDSRVRLLEKRVVDKYCSGQEYYDSEEDRLGRIIETIEDCDAVIVMRIGYRPMEILEGKKIKVIQTCGSLDEAIRGAAESLQTVEESMKEVV